MKQYLDILQEILVSGRERGDRTGTGTLSIFDAKFKHDMRDGFPMLTTKKMFLRGVFWELMGFLNNDTDLRVLVDEGVKIWDGFRVPETGALNAPYGAGWRAFKTLDGDVDQFAYALDLLRNNPESRRILISAWNPGWMPEETRQKRLSYEERSELFEKLFPAEYADSREILSYPEIGGDWELGVIHMDEAKVPTHKTVPITPQDNVVNGKPCLTPCHWAFEFYTEEMTLEERWNSNALPLNAKHIEQAQDELAGYVGDNGVEYLQELQHKYLDDYNVPRRYLSLKWHQRSTDAFLGMPFNIASYALLLQMVAHEVGMEPHMLIGDLSNVHIYSNHMDQVKEQLTREPLELPTLKLIRNPERIEDYQWEDISLSSYNSHPAIKGDIAV